MRNTSHAIILASILLILTPIQAVQPSQPAAINQGTTDYPWTMFRQNPQRTGTTPTNAPASPTLMWKKATGGPVYASPIVSDGTVFIPSWDGNLYALDEYSGQLRWTFTTSGPIYSSPAVDNGVVYLASRDGQVYAINEQTGVQVWRTNNIFNNPSFPITSSLLVANGKVFFGNWCLGPRCNPIGYLEALDSTNGNILWINATSSAVISSPSIDNGRVFFGEDDGTIIALNETTARRIWSTSVGSPVRNAPAVANGRVYVGSFNRFYALSQATGATAWSFNTNNANTTSAAVYQGTVYFGTGRGNVYAVNATTGVLIWGSNLSSGAITSSPALAVGSKTLLVGSNDHNLYALDMMTGTSIWSNSTSAPVSSSPAVADGRVFFGSQDSIVYALGAKVPQLRVTILPGKTSQLPGEMSNLTITVTDGTNPVTANLTLTSSSGGGLSPPVEISLGQYASNYTAPLVTSPTTTTIQVTASAAGFLDGSTQAGITLNPYPPLTVLATAQPSSVSAGGSVLLMIQVQNGSIPVAGAEISLSSNPSDSGTFSDVADLGNGTYTATFTPELQSTNPTLTVHASKGFSNGDALPVTITIVGIPDLTNAKAFGIPVWLIAGGILALFLISLMAIIASKRRNAPSIGSYEPAYALQGLGLPGSLI